jgi:vacuolar-type H+-ATPase subunit E/Vma4
VPYGELLRALEAEVRDQCRAVEESARAESLRIQEEGRRLTAAAREEALSLARADVEAVLDGARRRAARVEDLAVLAEKRRLLAEVRERVAGKLASRSTPELSCALLAEALGDDDGSPLVVTCDPGHAATCREWLRLHRPDAAARASVVERPSPCGGIELSVGELLVVDDTLPARLDLAWAALEPELARGVTGDGDA